MRSVLAALLATVVLLSAAATHAHAAPSHGHERCAVCVVRGAEPVSAATPGPAPAAVFAGVVVVEPGLPPVTGAPLGAIPGQSPPAA